jgi:hypothetical protein
MAVGDGLEEGSSVPLTGPGYGWDGARCRS